jgi:predicted transglutaminase-like cysteine proteinase
MTRWTAHARRLLLLSALGASAVFGCVALAPHPTAYQYFEQPANDDPWSRKIARWQVRERAIGDPDQLAPGLSTVASGPREPTREGDAVGLRVSYFAFRADHKRETARAIASWVQEQAKRHYVPDGPYDHWATLEETLAHNGDDCDGLELLTYHFLRDAGFTEQEVFRAIVLRPSDGQHHMVTLWFEERGDPWVIDPTGAMIAGMPRISQVPDWVPIKLFSETEEFTVRGPGLERTIAGSDRLRLTAR